MVGWVERSDTHQAARVIGVDAAHDGFRKALNPSCMICPRRFESRRRYTAFWQPTEVSNGQTHDPHHPRGRRFGGSGVGTSRLGQLRRHQGLHSAPVESLVWADPHSHVMLKYNGATWEATLAPLFRMQARGITQDMLKPGTQVVVEGHPSTRLEHEMRAERITVAGKVVELR